MTPFVVYDVFTDQPFGGNPLAVIPDATALPDHHLQQIAREFNFSETTFVYPPADPSHSARVRIFTPTQEVRFAGHPIIGTAMALADLGRGPDMVFELGIGPIPVRVSGREAHFTTSAPLDILAHPDASLVAACLGLSAGAIRTDTHPPVQASLGLPFVFAELTDRATLSACSPVIDAFRQGSRLHPSGFDFAVYAYVRDGAQIDGRMFGPLDNIPEDPATGSASATIAAILANQLGTPLSLTLHQGDDMGRPSVIRAHVAAGSPPAVTIRGSAVKMMEGQLVL